MNDNDYVFRQGGQKAAQSAKRNHLITYSSNGWKRNATEFDQINADFLTIAHSLRWSIIFRKWFDGLRKHYSFLYFGLWTLGKCASG